MPMEALIEDIKKLPEEGYEDLVAYVEFLNFKFKISRSPEKTRQIGGFRGELKYMADDFDAPIEDFKEYM